MRVRTSFYNIWLNDKLLRRLLKNAAALFTGSAGASLLGLLSLAMTARALNKDQFGVLVLISTYVLFVDKLVNFQSWQAVIKYGAEAIFNKRDDDLKSLFKFGFMLDGCTAMLGAVIAASAAGVVGHLFSWNEQQVLMATAYSLAIIFNIGGTPIAILRLYGKYNRAAIQQIYSALFKLAGVAVAYFVGAGLWGFLLVWVLTDILGKLLLIYYAFDELTSQGVGGIYSAAVGDVNCRFKGLWSFVLTTNANSSLRMSIREVDIFIVGIVAGGEGAGLFKIVKSVASVIGKIADPLYNSIYPELSSLVAENKYSKLKSLCLRASLMSGLFGLIVYGLFLLIGEEALGLLFGEDFVGAYIPAAIYMAAQLVWLFMFPLSGLILALGYPKATLYVLLLSSLAYFPLLFYLVDVFGMNGASSAAVFFYIIWAVLLSIIVIFAYKRRVREFERDVV